MATDVPYGHSVTIPFSFVDASGNAAQVDGLPVVSATLGEVTVGPNTDANTSAQYPFAAVLTIGAVGIASVSVTADVDRGEGVTNKGFSLGDFNGLASPEADAIVVGTPVIN